MRARLSIALRSFIVLCLTPALILSSGAAALAQTPPSYMNLITTHQGMTSAQVAEQNVLDLNVAKFGFYDRALKQYQQNLLAQYPVILALFSGAGGDLTLYRPGMAPLKAPSVPLVYQVLKSVGHSSMAVFQIAGPHIGTPTDQSWRGLMEVDRAQHKLALDTLAGVDMDPAWRDNCRTILANNLAYLEATLAKNAVVYADLEAFAKKQAPFLAKNVAWAAETQVAHWMKVVGDWKQMLGADWDKTYGVTNSLYVTRQNNIIFSVLAQYFGKDALNSRLMLFETTSFFTTPDAMLNLLARVVADRSVGAVFFGNYYLMDYELMGGNARDAIEAEAKKRGMTAFLPPLVPFGAHEWPWMVTPGPGPATIKQLLSP